MTPDEETPDLTDMNVRLRLHRTTTPADLTARLFGTPTPNTTGDDTTDGDDAA